MQGIAVPNMNTKSGNTTGLALCPSVKDAILYRVG